MKKQTSLDFSISATSVIIVILAVGVLVFGAMAHFNALEPQKPNENKPMKALHTLFAFCLLVFAASCSIQKQAPKYEYYWYSQQAYEWNEALRSRPYQNAGMTVPAKTKIDGEPYTCHCPPDFIKSTYKKNFPDVKLVKRLRSGDGVVSVEFK